MSALHYNPALAALVAGYNFGRWRLVHLPTLEVDYSSSYTNQEPFRLDLFLPNFQCSYNI